MEKTDRETTLRSGHRSGSFSIDSLLSNTYKTTTPDQDSNSNALHYFNDLDILDRKCKNTPKDDYLHEPDLPPDFSQKHLSLVRHVKNIDTYFPWISPNSPIFTHSHHENPYDDAKRITPATTEAMELINFSAAYSNLHLPFFYSSWLPAANPVTKNTGEGDYACNQAYSRNSPREENSDSDDSKSDVSRVSDTPKDFSCTKRHNGEYFWFFFL